MKTKLDEIYESKIVHSSFLDKESVVDAMTDSYILGLRESEEKYNKLKPLMIGKKGKKNKNNYSNKNKIGIKEWKIYRP
mgnify:CR=1 FL=1